jgi:hypothetical protein
MVLQDVLFLGTERRETRYWLVQVFVRHERRAERWRAWEGGMASQSEPDTGPRVVIVVVILAACHITWELEAQAQLVADVAKGHQVAPCGLVDPGEGTRILFLSYGEVYIPPDGSH